MDVISFDLDETLIHATKCHWKAFNESFKKNNLKIITYKKLLPLLDGRHAHQIIKVLFPKLSNKEIDKITKEHHKLIGIKYGKHAKRIPGTIQTLKKLKKKYKIGLITNCSNKEVNGLLKGAKINKKLFDFIITKDNVKRSKPYPDEIFKAQKLMHHKVNYHVGDSPYDIIAAKKAKTKAIAVLTGVHSKNRLQKEKPYKIIKSLKELEKILGIT